MDLQNWKNFYKSKLFWVGFAGAAYYGLQLVGIDVPVPEGDLKELMDMVYALLVLVLRFKTDKAIKLTL